MNKKAVVGIGVLIIFISSVLIAAVSAGVLLNTQQKLQQGALMTGKEAEKSVTSAIMIQKVNAIDNHEGFNTIEMKVKLAAGGEALRFNRTSIGFSSSKSAATILFDGEEFFTTKLQRELDFEINLTPQKMKTDIDGDIKEEEIMIIDSTTLRINLSTGEHIDITIPSIALPGTNIFLNETLNHQSREKGYLIINTTTTKADVLDAGSITLKMNEYGQGKFQIKHLIKSSTYLKEVLQQGEIVSVKFETPHTVGAEEMVNIMFYTARGIPSNVVMYTPEVMTNQFFTLYP